MTTKTKSTKKPAKDGPFPMKDGPFPMWGRLAVKRRFGKDAPFPFAAGLYWEKIPFHTVYQGNKGPKTPMNGVLRTKSDGATQLPGIELSAVNFDQEEVIFVALGARPTNGSMVEINQVIYLTDRGPQFSGPLTMVDYGEYQSAGSADVVTYPLHVVKLKKLDGTETQFSQS